MHAPNDFTQHVCVDSTVQACLEMVIGVLGCMALIAVLVPWFLACIPPFVIALFYYQKRYVVISRELQRLDGVSRSPMYAHLSQTMQVKYGSTTLDSELSFNSTRILVGSWLFCIQHFP